ncbi:TetR/AcrR family transcriptional regulator [Actinoallomurus soli]|uniref:TetR/AcrR family transcriptional regulator n=1 Tax=Actinoallomurus soli TaxID=2952535 RepID=UPI0020931EED|nr:TetR/AcrR family transcriptional regulator [Actinoallomurus soli]MCO5974821.1 TetR/AcrR family transcriptional regulator [Actinoallomurus soli]
MSVSLLQAAYTRLAVTANPIQAAQLAVSAKWGDEQHEAAVGLGAVASDGARGDQGRCTQLFISQGFERTTIALAEEAGLSQRTLFRYFGTKEELVCGEQDELGELFVQLAAEQSDNASVWQVLRDGFVTVLTANHSLEQTLRISTLIFRTPALHSSYTQKRLGWAVSLMPVIRERLLAHGSEASRVDHEARTVIAVAFAGADASGPGARHAERPTWSLSTTSPSISRAPPRCSVVRDRPHGEDRRTTRRQGGPVRANGPLPEQDRMRTAGRLLIFDRFSTARTVARRGVTPALA